ncbi:MAG: amino acid dehydrogenase [Gammaproteobacteria bacterium]|nr:amino acid dehydrogenase [Gammaproteobacteria bacterium]
MKISTINASAYTDYDDHEKVIECVDKSSGLRAYIAIHNRNLGPALGGCRIWPYASRDEAITDVLRLSRGMTYKSAMAELPLGGGKAVIVANPKTDKSKDMLIAMGEFVESLDGAYITAEDSGTSVEDLETIGTRTKHVAGVNRKQLRDGSEVSGDPSPSTAYGVFVGVVASVKHRFSSNNLAGIKVAIQGVGNVGKRLASFLADAGARVYVADLYSEAVNDLADAVDVIPVDLNEIHKLDVDVFAPCALGGFINEQTLHEIKAPVIAGAANNQLANPAIGGLLVQSRKLYAPDYVINAGGIIDIFYERSCYDHERVTHHIERIGDNLEEIFVLAKETGQPTQLITDKIAESRFACPKPQAPVLSHRRRNSQEIPSSSVCF